MSPNRFHTVSVGSDEQALRFAFQKCGALLQSRGCTAMGLAVHSKANLDSVVKTVFGDDVVHVLERDNKLEMKGITLYLLTDKIQLRKLEGPVVAAFIDPDKLDKIISCYGVTDVVFVPWATEDLPTYLVTHPSSEEIFRSTSSHTFSEE